VLDAQHLHQVGGEQGDVLGAFISASG
jgi:hypothetical protein